jgi:hypothetical protein
MTAFLTPSLNPMLARTFPHLMEFYMQTATANDTFFGGTR